METRTDVRSKMSIALWFAQGLLGLFFLLVGGSKLTMPPEALTAHLPVSAEFLRFIGVAETLGALGLILPGLLRIGTSLTPWAAVGLVIIMNGATGFTLAAGSGAQATAPFAIGLLLALVAYGRWRLAPHRSSSLVPSAMRSAPAGA